MKNYYYASVYGKLPKKRKIQRFESRIETFSKLEGIAAIEKLIKEYNIREANNANIQSWAGDESKFIDSDGIEQTMIWRSCFPNGERVNL